ncbi:MAG: hypothetical protein J7J01_00965 [Methanophagales archaeon]|nr:hypothetical protein [Methanophagales archaeon]
MNELNFVRLLDVLSELNYTLKAINERLCEISTALWALEEIERRREQREQQERKERRETRQEGKVSKWVRFATIQITPDPESYTTYHLLPRLPDTPVRCYVGIRNTAVGEEISVRVCDAQKQTIIEKTLTHSDLILLPKDAAYVQAKTRLAKSTAYVELSLFAEEGDEKNEGGDVV